MPTNTANHDEWLTPPEIIGTDIHYLPLIPPINETGKKYGRLTVLEYYVSQHDRSGGRWLCQCECGFQCIVRGRDLRRGRVTECMKCYAIRRKEEGK